MKNYLTIAAFAAVLVSCKSSDNELAALEKAKKDTLLESAKPVDNFNYMAERVADLQILRYNIPDFDKLDLKTKTLLYYLYEAALSGRDIFYDQNYKYNLIIRKTLEAILSTESHDNQSEDFKKLEAYAKRVWFSNGIHHHYSNDKFVPECTEAFFTHVLEHVEDSKLPLQAGQSKADFIKFITPLIYDMNIATRKVEQDSKKDLVTSSAVNFYEGVTEKEVTAFYTDMIKNESKNFVSYDWHGKKLTEKPWFGLNSKVVKENGKVVEKKWMVGGMYTQSIEKIVFWLEKAIPYTENNEQKTALEALVKFYRTGSISDFDAYNIAWINDTISSVDVVNGFIESYEDPLGRKSAFESVVSVRDIEASKRIALIGDNAQWFEDNSTILPQHKKKNVTGISAKVINAVIEAGDAAPSTPIGINLPNNEWIRERHGSKSVNLGNIVDAYEKASGGSVVNEFYYNEDTKERVKKYAGLADKLHTDMHEVIGHASGQLESGVESHSETLKNYASALEEGRADLVALYYLMDQKLVDLGVMPSLDYGRAAYDEYITNGMIVQLSRIKQGKDIEEAHMRNRKMIAEWAFEKGKKDNVIEKKVENNKTYFVVNDYDKLRVLFGELLKEVQRVKSQGDYKAGRDLIENYGVKIDPKLHAEVLERYAKLDMAPYKGFIQPKLVPVLDGDKIIDVKVEYPEDFKQQMLEYGKNYGLLPAYN